MSYIIVQHTDGAAHGDVTSHYHHESRRDQPTTYEGRTASSHLNGIIAFNMLDALIDETGTSIKKFKSEREAEDFLSECGVENWSEYYIEITRMH